ncbi:MAG: hypothetical protein ACYCOU_13385 [Sulfobacillus sp.]
MNGKACPYEIFINTLNKDFHSEITVITRTLSALFRREQDCSFICQELMEIYDPIGGFWKDTTYYGSLYALLGHILQKHFNKSD